MTKVAIYARTSTNSQATGLESQLLALKSYCETKGIANYQVYTDVGISGAKSSRPGLDQLLLDARNGSINAVFTYSLSRLSRSTSHLLQVIKFLSDSGIGFVSLSESIDLGSPMGMMILTVLGAVAQLEREITVERVKTGLINARAKGKILGAPKRHSDKEQLIRHLNQQGLPHREIGRLSGVSQSTVSRMLKAT